jgi:hypothetical protein
MLDEHRQAQAGARALGRMRSSQGGGRRLCAPPAGPAGLCRAVAPRTAVAIREPLGPFESILFYRKMVIRVVGVAILGAQELIVPLIKALRRRPVAISPYRRTIATLR